MIKLTNVVALEMVLGMEEVKKNSELVEKLEKMKLQFEKKNSSGTTGTGKLTKTQIENNEIMEQIVAELESQEQAIQIKELQTVAGFEKYSNQKLSALMKKLVETGRVEKVIEKRVTKFQIKKLLQIELTGNNSEE